MLELMKKVVLTGLGAAAMTKEKVQEIAKELAEQATMSEKEGQEFRACDMLLLESLSLFCGDLIRNHRLVDELQTMSVTMVRALVSAVDQKDTYTSGHSIRVGFYSTLLGRAAGLNEREMRDLKWSALLHDVGKIGSRDDVLKKPGKLTK